MGKGWRVSAVKMLFLSPIDLHGTKFPYGTYIPDMVLWQCERA